MVVMFLLTSAGPGKSTILYRSTFFPIRKFTDSEYERSLVVETSRLNDNPIVTAFDGLSKETGDTTNETTKQVCDRLRREREDALKSVIDRVKEEYDIRISLGTLSPAGSILGDLDPYSTPETETGGILTLHNELFDGPKFALWHAVHRCWICILVCDWTENKIVAMRILKQTMKSILERLDRPSPVEIVQNIHVVSAAVNVFLPNGQLLFMNHAVIAQMNKKLDEILKRKMH